MAHHKRNILVIASRFPFPLEKGDKLRLYHQLQGLNQSFHVHLVAINDKELKSTQIEKINSIVHKLTIIKIPIWLRFLNVIGCFLRGEPTQLAYFYSKKAKMQIDEIISQNHFDLIYGHLARTWLYLRGKENCIVDLMDSFSEIAKMRANKYSRFSPARWFWSLESKRMAAVEVEIINSCQTSLLISEVEQKRLPKIIDPSKTAIISNGVDTSFFHPNSSIPKTHDIVFVGNLGYNPNAVAVDFLLHELMPPLLELRPKTKLLIAGANAHSSLVKQNNQSVDIIGWQDDIREAYWRGKLMVAPIFLGSGMQNKVLESIACGTAVITTKRVRESFVSMKDLIVECQSIDEFVNSIIELLDDHSKRNNLSTLARENLNKYFCWDKSNEKLRGLLHKVIEG